MATENRNPRPAWFWPVIAFIVGTLFGLIVLGWGLFPVTYKNTLPPDLRVAERLEYLAMTAESYAATGDLASAQSRLSTWAPEQLYDDIMMLESQLQSRGDPLRLGQVELLRTQLNVPTPDFPAADFDEPEASGEASGLLRTLGTVVLWAGLALAGVLLILWLWRRWQASSAPVEPVAPAEPAERRPAPRDVGMEPFPQTQVAATAAAERPPATWSQPVYSEKTLVEEVDDIAEAEEAEALAEDLVEEETPALVAAPAAPRPAASVAAAAVGEFRARYQMGESDYDEAFTITDASGGYLGECSLSLQRPVGRAHDQAAALEVLLYDAKDPTPQVIVLMTEAASRDQGLRNLLAGENPVQVVRPGTQFLMESHKLMLQGEIEELGVAEQEPLGAIISEMQVRLLVYSKGR
jgi:hypothetical protein